ncbi:ubiquitin carboxyl-terminal hydrolase-domain-containing protein [Podospora australis]|uniref:PAN2-PAN3 deadenylation complex catalytic subunit PAN2 n=1 Tax=Podospora australis TaxID=1536484 RepID=A0AAN7AJE9_9PEZI|nr:ubiquitin carboxyl-terminal hydrolase-domain-containing protein [Podospora australis]
MDPDWNEVNRIVYPPHPVPPPKTTIPVPGQGPPTIPGGGLGGVASGLLGVGPQGVAPILPNLNLQPTSGTEYPPRPTALAFDTSAELLWTGDTRGCVNSFYSRDLQRYTAFKTHTNPHGGPVRQFLFHEKGVIALSGQTVHMASRRGPAMWNISDEGMKDMKCMSFTSKGTAEILVAGWQDTMFVVDVNKGEITKKLPAEHHYSIIKKSRVLCAATRTGQVDLLDPVTFKIIKSWQAHSAFINDMDAQTDFIVTCGGSFKQQGPIQYMLDSFINVYDLKNMTALSPLPFTPLAAYVRLHPRMSTTTLVTSQHGQMHLLDIMNPNTTSVRYASIPPSAYVNLFEIAPSGRALAMGDTDRKIYLWGSPNDGIYFTDMRLPLHIPEPEQPPPDIDWNNDTPLNMIGMPYYREQLLSALPVDIISDVGAPPLQFDNTYLNTLQHTTEGFWYGKNTRGTRPNQIEDTRALMESRKPVPPKFLHERYRESSDGATEEGSHDDGRQSSADFTPDDAIESLKPAPPEMYMPLEIKYSKFGVDDFDFRFYNKSQYSGLQNHIPNSYANSLIQVMNYTPLLRNMALQHVATSCLDQSCLLCEFGFLFDMLQKAEGATCHATNMFKTITSEFQAEQSHLIEEDYVFNEAPANKPNSKIQRLNKALLERFSKEYQSITPVSTALERDVLRLPNDAPLHELTSRMLCTKTVLNVSCPTCKAGTTKPDKMSTVDLVYPSQKASGQRSRAPKPTFSMALKMSAEKDVLTKGWCAGCRKHKDIKNRNDVETVAAVLAINTQIINDDQKKLWATPGWLPEEIGIVIGQNSVHCFEGDDLKLHLRRGAHDITVYSLVGMVVNIQRPRRPHLVAMVNVAHSDPVPSAESKWHLFNDFRVRRVSTAEALTFNEAWKWPSVLMYQVKAANNRSNVEWKNNLDTSILYRDLSLHPYEKSYRLLDQETEKPGPNTIVALDTEYVSLKDQELQINSSGGMETIRPMWLALGRVSVIRGYGELEGTAFIDDWITIREPVVDYLTKYSGITASDLDVRTSRHTLVPLKTAYKKIWVLLNLGCVFLGHGLKQDFRVMDIQIPAAQIIDTQKIYYRPERKRLLSLSLLSLLVLRKKIQENSHDSIEDSLTALQLYRKYEEYVDAGLWERELDNIYARGKAINWNAKNDDTVSIQKTGTPPLLAAQAAGVATRPTTPTRSTGSTSVPSSTQGVGGGEQGGPTPSVSTSAFGVTPAFTPSRGRLTGSPMPRGKGGSN